MTGPRDEAQSFDYLDDPALRPTAELVHQVMHSGPPRPTFRDDLRSRLLAAHAAAVAETTAVIPAVDVTAPIPAVDVTAPIPAGDITAPIPATKVRVPRSRPLAGLRGRVGGWRRGYVFALTGAVAAAAVVVAAVVQLITATPVPVSVTAVGDVAGAVSAAPGDPLRLRFTTPLDPGTTGKALRLAPATAVQTSWQGSTLTISAVHGFAPNTAYRLIIDHGTARTAGGAPLAADIRLAWGTAPTAEAGPATGAPTTLAPTTVADAADGSEAVVTGDGALLLTGAVAGAGTDYHSGLVRIAGGGGTRLAAATDAVCLSRSGASVAYLSQTGGGSQIVFADGDGTAENRVSVAVDGGSPLGWINDAEVSFVGGGRLRAVDRAGHVRVLADAPVDPTKDTVVIAPGGRYVYLRAAGSTSAGEIIDVPTGARHPLPGATDAVAFSADGATVVWLDGSTRLATAPSAGGPVLTADLPVQAGDRLSDLAVSPTGSRLAYSVTHPDGRAELRVAALPDGRTVAVSTAGAGASPNWSPSGRMFTVLAGGSRIETVAVAAADPSARVAATATTFADAQVGGDPDAQQALAGPDLIRPVLPPVTRAAVLWVAVGADGTATARVRLTADGGPAGSAASQAEETLTLDTGSGSGAPVVRRVSVEPFRPVPAGPQLARLDTDAVPGVVSLTFDSDLDPGSVPGAIGLATPDGGTVASTVQYNPLTRTVTLRPASRPGTGVVVRVGTGLRDVYGQPLAGQLSIPVTLGG
jgi:hypothetical protein